MKVPSYNPTLEPVVAVSWDKHERTGLRFKKHYGLVGVCLAENDKNKIFFVDFDEPAIKAALQAQDDSRWHKLPPKKTYGLSFRDAQRLALSYSQAAGVVLQTELGEAIGCLTMSLPPKSRWSEEFPHPKIEKAHDLRATLLRWQTSIEGVFVEPTQ